MFGEFRGNTGTALAFCMYIEHVKVFRFVLSPYSLVATCNNVQNGIFRKYIGTFTVYCRHREPVKPFGFLLSPYSLIRDLQRYAKLIFRDSVGIFIAYCKWTEAVKLCTSLLSMYRLIETCNNIQNSAYLWPGEGDGVSRNFMYYFRGSRCHNVWEPLPQRT
jgi:hypothetical protein